jgi:diguanylate cyclase (GGDEF)-like protein
MATNIASTAGQRRAAGPEGPDHDAADRANRAAAVRAMRWRASAATVLAIFAMAVVWALIGRTSLTYWRLPGQILLLVFPTAAGVLAWRSGRGAPTNLRRAFRLLGVGAFTVALGQLVVLVGAGAGVAPRAAVLLFLLYHPLFVLAAISALGSLRDRAAAVDVALDAILVIGAVLVVALRYVWGPGAVEPLSSPSGALTLATQVTALASIFFGGLLLVWHDPALPTRSVAGLVGSAVFFSIDSMLVSVGFHASAPRNGGLMDVAWLAGWVCVMGAVAGVSWGPGGHLREHGLASLTDRLPRVIVPGAALIVGLVALDSVRFPVLPQTAIVLGLVGLVLAVRSARALAEARRGREEHRQLEHTRALIEVSRNLACMTELDATLQLVSDWAARLLGTPSTGIELLTDDGAFLELRTTWNLPREKLPSRFAVAGSFTGEVVRAGVARATADAAADPYMASESARLLGHSPVAAAPLRFRGQILGVLFACMREEPFRAGDLELLQALADQAAIAIQNARLFEDVRTLSVTDPLTGLPNRRQLEYDLAREFAAARRGRRLTLVMLDLDNFKEYNDTHGHLAGDELLRLFSDVLGNGSRAMNLAARFGGDEFLAVLADCDAEGAEMFVQRLRDRLAERVASLGITGITVSAGIAEYDASVESPEDLIREADAALYRTKSLRPVS